jgi:hypothetical protein
MVIALFITDNKMVETFGIARFGSQIIVQFIPKRMKDSERVSAWFFSKLKSCFVFC